jgi:hypothetical protein
MANKINKFIYIVDIPGDELFAYRSLQELADADIEDNREVLVYELKDNKKVMRDIKLI